MDRANLDLNILNEHSIYHMERKNLNKNYWKNKYRINFCC